MCKDPVDDGELKHKIVIIQRGDCMFVEKVMSLQKWLFHLFIFKDFYMFDFIVYFLKLMVWLWVTLEWGGFFKFKQYNRWGSDGLRLN